MTQYIKNKTGILIKYMIKQMYLVSISNLDDSSLCFFTFFPACSDFFSFLFFFDFLVLLELKSKSAIL